MVPELRVLASGHLAACHYAEDIEAMHADLQAAGAHSGMARPASLQCHYLGVGAFDKVEIETVSLRKAKRAESVRVSITPTISTPSASGC